MKKQNIVKKAKDFSRIIKKRQGKATKYFILNKETNTENLPKFGITFTKNIGNAVTRNKLKRRIKSIIDNNKEIYETNQNYILIARKTALELTYQQMEEEVIKIFKQVKGEVNEKYKKNN